MTDPEPERIIRVILDASAAAEYRRSVHVGDVIAHLGTESALYLDASEEDLPGVPAFGCPYWRCRQHGNAPRTRRPRI